MGTRFGQLQGTFGANEMSVCKQDLMLQEEINCETTISVRAAASNQSLSGGQGFLKCSYQSKCSSNRCKCKKNGKFAKNTSLETEFPSPFFRLVSFANTPPKDNISV